MPRLLFWLRTGRCALPILPLIVIAGCHTARPDPAAETAIAAAAGMEDLVVYRTEGGPLDEGRDGDTLTMPEAVRRAVMSDPRLQAALARVRIAMADADQARLLPNPILGIVVRWGRGEPQIEASLAMELLGVLQSPGRARAADQRLRAAASQSVTAALDIIAEAQERYIAVQTGEREVPLLEGRLELVRRLEQLADARLEAGEGRRGDVTTLRAQRIELEVEIADARLQLRDERLRLARLIGEPSSPADWKVDEWTGPAPIAGPEERWIEAGLAYRPEVHSAFWTLAALGDEVAMLPLKLWEGSEGSIEIEKDGDWSAGPGLQVPIPVFDVGQARAARQAAEIGEARHQLTQARRLVVEETRAAFASLTTGESNLRRVRDELIPVHRLRREQAEDAYRAGLSDLTDLLLAEQDLRTIEIKGLQFEQRAAIAAVRLYRAVGGPGIAAPLAGGGELSTQDPLIPSSTTTGVAP